jgi:hypothetical protein
MKLSPRMIASLTGIAVLAVAMVVSFMLFGADEANHPAAAAQVVTLAAGATSTTAATEPMQEHILSADFAVAYTSVAQLKDAADLVVRGEVIAVSYLDFNTATQTRVTLKVDKCLKGGVAAGQEITILEPGGVTTAANVVGDKFGAPTKEQAETKVKVLLEGAPLTQVGEKCLYFLGKGDIAIVSGTYYVPMGAFQGRFTIGDGVAKRFVPADFGAKYTALPMDESAIDDAVAEATAQ